MPAYPLESMKKHSPDHDSAILAREAKENSDFSIETMELVLSAMVIPWNRSRRNVIPEGEDAVKGMLLGAYTYANEAGIAALTKKHQAEVEFLCGVMGHYDSTFEHTSIQINLDYAARPHTDRNNEGLSYIIAVGNYVSGELWVEIEDGQEEYQIPKDGQILVIDPMNEFQVYLSI